MRRLWLFFAVMVMVLGQGVPFPSAPQNSSPQNSSGDVRLPNGKSQRDAIIQADHKSNQKDAAELVLLAQELKDELDNSDSYVVSVKTLKKLDDIEKLAKGIRGRLKRF